MTSLGHKAVRESGGWLLCLSSSSINRAKGRTGNSQCHSFLLVELEALVLHFEQEGVEVTAKTDCLFGMVHYKIKLKGACRRQQF